MDKHSKVKPEIGTRVKIGSKISKYNGKYGRIERYCKGKYPDCCMVNIDGGKAVRYCYYTLLPADEGAGHVPNFDAQEDGNKVNTVTVRWFDSYLEEFEATEVRFGSDILFLRLTDGKNRHIPLRQVRWFGMSVESHQSWGGRNKNECEGVCGLQMSSVWAAHDHRPIAGSGEGHPPQAVYESSAEPAACRKPVAPQSSDARSMQMS